MKTIGILFVTVILSVSSLKGQIENLTWNYPLKSGVKAWDDIESYDERLKTYNIPEKIVKRMSTTNLVETCLNYPELRLIMTRNSLQLGYDYISSIFNGFTELEGRPDAGKILLQVYENHSPLQINAYLTPLDKGRYSFRIAYLELILSQPKILSSLDKKDKIKLLQLATKYYREKESCSNDYSLFSLSTPALLLGRFLVSENDKDFMNLKKESNDLKNFIDLSLPIDKVRMDDVIIRTENYLIKMCDE